MRSSTASLSAFKISVAGRGASLTGFQFVRIHCQAHAAARFAPFETGFDEDFIQSFFLGLLLDQSAPRHDHRVDVRADFFALDHGRGCPQILDPGIGAGTDKDAINFDIFDWRSRF